MTIESYGGLEAPIPEIVDFLDTLAFVPAQHDPRWGSVFSELPNEDFHVLVARDGTQIVAVTSFTIFSGPLGPILHANPYMGYGGCSGLLHRRAETVPKLIGALLEEAVQHGCLTATVATPPFSEESLDLYVQALKPDYRFDNFYQYHLLDCHPLDKLKPKRRQSFQNEIRHAESAGITIVRATSPAQVAAWLNIYEERYAEIRAVPLPRRFHEMLWRTFDPCRKARLDLAYLEGELLGGTLFLEGTGVVDYFSTAFKTETMKLYPGTLILHRAIADFISRGIKRFNWQSSPSRTGGVYQFKQRWGALDGEHHILTRVIGDEKVLTSRPLAEVRQGYAPHFVLPYDLWNQ